MNTVISEPTTAGGAAQFNREYLQRLQGGDPDTQRHFTRYFGGVLTHKARSRVRSPQLGEDVRQETLLRVLTIVRRGGVDHPERLEALVNSIFNHVLLEVFRKEGRMCSTPIVPEPADRMPSPESTLLERQQTFEVRRILDTLPPKDRELLRQLFLEERDRDEVCRTFQVDREYLRVLLHRAKTRFRAALECSNENVKDSTLRDRGPTTAARLRSRHFHGLPA